MNNDYLPSGLNEEDELLHQPTDELKWRESYYFNWTDLANKISGFSTIGIVPNENKREFVFLLFLKDRNEIYYKEPRLLEYDKDINVMLRDKKLSYMLIKPFNIWNISYNSRKIRLDLTFETRFPTHNFGKDSSKSWHQHFESSGVITGNLTYKNGKNIKINGYGQRDKSWGFRDWHQFDKWYAGHFQFKDWSCAFRKDYSKKKIDLSGHVSNKEGNILLSSLNIETLNDKDQFKSPISAIYEFEDKKGNLYEIKASRMFKNSFIRFARDFQGGFTELFEQMVIMENVNTGEIGTGMMEHLRTNR
ncbi:MAG: DUF7065 domain-containing protein [Promethearchaeota archaeon]